MRYEVPRFTALMIALLAPLYGVALSTGVTVLLLAVAVGLTGSNLAEFYATVFSRGEVRTVTVLGYALFLVYVVFATIVAISARRRWMNRWHFN